MVVTNRRLVGVPRLAKLSTRVLSSASARRGTACASTAGVKAPATLRAGRQAKVRKWRSRDNGGGTTRRNLRTRCAGRQHERFRSPEAISKGGCRHSSPISKRFGESLPRRLTGRGAPFTGLMALAPLQAPPRLRHARSSTLSIARRSLGRSRSIIERMMARRSAARSQLTREGTQCVTGEQKNAREERA